VSKFEILSLLTSILAVSVSLLALYRTRKTQNAFLELEKVHAELSRKQLEEFKEKEKLKSKALLKAEMEHGSSSTYYIHILNNGNSCAKNITFELDEGCEHNPLIKGDYDNKLPYQILNPNEEFRLFASILLSVSQSIYPIILKWMNEDGTNGECQCVLSR
jgi:hypothetical protein